MFCSSPHVVSGQSLVNSRCLRSVGRVAGATVFLRTLLVVRDSILIEAPPSSPSCRVRLTEFEVIEKGHVDCLRSSGKR